MNLLYEQPDSANATRTIDDVSQVYRVCISSLHVSCLLHAACCSLIADSELRKQQSNSAFSNDLTSPPKRRRRRCGRRRTRRSRPPPPPAATEAAEAAAESAAEPPPPNGPMPLFQPLHGPPPQRPRRRRRPRRLTRITMMIQKHDDPTTECRSRWRRGGPASRGTSCSVTPRPSAMRLMMRVAPASSPRAVVAVAELRGDGVADRLAGEAVGDELLEVVADLDSAPGDPRPRRRSAGRCPCPCRRCRGRRSRTSSPAYSSMSPYGWNVGPWRRRRRRRLPPAARGCAGRAPPRSPRR